ncbi:MoaD/ThiS family protein [Spongiimicrobium salis]|uniref:MoaD/ThiS family protein n=1 Tax=Spongiimicrobium salis TaxID=1667022 RepID=UPI00374D1FE6
MTILLFGITKDIIGASSLSLPMSNGMGGKSPKTVGELKTYLSNTYPDLQKLSSMAVAVNNAYAEDTTVIDAFDEVALIPPVSGG